jgi:uncharacterized membrane protein
MSRRRLAISVILNVPLADTLTYSIPTSTDASLAAILPEE